MLVAAIFKTLRHLPSSLKEKDVKISICNTSTEQNSDLRCVTVFSFEIASSPTKIKIQLCREKNVVPWPYSRRGVRCWLTGISVCRTHHLLTHIRYLGYHQSYILGVRVTHTDRIRSWHSEFRWSGVTRVHCLLLRSWERQWIPPLSPVIRLLSFAPRAFKKFLPVWR